MKTRVSLRAAVEEVLMLPDEEWRAFVDARTGKVFTVPPPEYVDAVDGDESDPDQALRDIENGRFLPLLQKIDIDEYRIMQKFAYRQPEARGERLLAAIRGRGAFRRFKDLVYELGVSDEWYAYQSGAVARLIRAHLEVQDAPIEVVDDVTPPPTESAEENTGPPTPFGKEHAERYDDAFKKLAPFKDALHIGLRSTLAHLPDDAHVLCVGAGTGAEILYLAEQFPGWRFTALDLSEPMLDVCRRRVSAAGFDARCSYHVGPTSSLKHTEPFDAATCILVSQFIVELDARRAFFQSIHQRLRPRGTLVTADLTCDLDDEESGELLELWRHTLAYSQDRTPDQMDGAMAALGEAVAPLSERDYAGLLQSAGFAQPTRFFQAVLIQGWLTHPRPA
jgi:tRNA (cmo5U34)-methyltransferase